jgi:hypothetical protein
MNFKIIKITAFKTVFFLLYNTEICNPYVLTDISRKAVDTIAYLQTQLFCSLSCVIEKFAKKFLGVMLFAFKIALCKHLGRQVCNIGQNKEPSQCFLRNIGLPTGRLSLFPHRWFYRFQTLYDS